MLVAVVAAFVGAGILLPGAPSAGGGAPPPARRVRDGAGREVALPARPERIISLAPSVTEMLFALGAGDRVVGVTDFCDYPPETASRPRIGGLINPDLERIVGLRPDLAIATTTGNYLDDAERIERLGIPVYTIDIPSIDAMLRTLQAVGEMVGEPGRAAALSAHLRSRVESARSASASRPRARALFVIEPDPLIAPGRATFLGEALGVAGADLVTVDAPSSWAQYDLEQVIGMKPDLILTSRTNRAWAEGLKARPEWMKVSAVARGRVRVLSDAIQHPGPRIVDGIEEVQRILAEMEKP